LSAVFRVITLHLIASSLRHLFLLLITADWNHHCGLSGRSDTSRIWSCL